MKSNYFIVYFYCQLSLQYIINYQLLLNPAYNTIYIDIPNNSTGNQSFNQVPRFESINGPLIDYQPVKLLLYANNPLDIYKTIIIH